MPRTVRHVSTFTLDGQRRATPVVSRTLLSLAISSAVPMRDEEELGSLERRLILHNAPPSPFPRPSPQAPLRRYPTPS